jgi:hypothetical protein
MLPAGEPTLPKSVNKQPALTLLNPAYEKTNHDHGDGVVMQFSGSTVTKKHFR